MCKFILKSRKKKKKRLYPFIANLALFFNHFWSKWIISNQLFPNPSCIQDIYSFNNIILLFSEKNKPHGYFHHFSIGNSKIFIIEENCHNYVVWYSFRGFHTLHQHCILSFGRLESQLIKSDDLSPRLQDTSPGSLCHIESTQLETHKNRI